MKYRAALHSGGRSGGGRVVAAFYDICSSISEGSPSAESIDGGVESCAVRREGFAGKDQGDIHESGAMQSSLENASGDEVTCGDDEVNEDVCTSSTSQPKETKAKADGRRDLITFIKDQRNGKLKKKLPSDQVMIDLTKQDLELKRDIVKQLKETDDDQKQQLKVMTETVGSLAQTISEGFLALKSFLNNQNTFPVQRHQNPSFSTLPVNTQNLYEQSHSYHQDGGNTYFTFQ